MMSKFGRKKDHRKMMLRNLLTSLIIFEKIKTTQTKAKEIKRLLDRVIHIAKKNTLAKRRWLLGYLTHKNAVKKLFEDLINRYQDRPSGYARSYYLAPRLGDGTKMMLLELIPGQKLETKEKSTDPKTESKTSTESIKRKTEKNKIRGNKTNIQVRTKNVHS